MVLWRPTSLSKITTPKDVLLIIGDWNTKVGSQETPGVTGKFGLGVRNEAGRRLIEFCQENALVITNTLFQQHKRRLHMDITRWPTLKSDWLYSLGQRWRSSIQSGKSRPGADCGSDHELLIAKFRLKLKKVGKTIRPFRYELNQITYDYTVEEGNFPIGVLDSSVGKELACNAGNPGSIPGSRRSAGEGISYPLLYS